MTTHPPALKPELLGCPFCGKAPYASEPHNGMITIKCVSDECFKPEIRYINEKYALQWWNARASFDVQYEDGYTDLSSAEDFAASYTPEIDNLASLIRQRDAALLRRAANADYVLVPREPTIEMWDAGTYELLFGKNPLMMWIAKNSVNRMYKAMINAAAQPITKDDSHG